jgi:hypothetical protein
MAQVLLPASDVSNAGLWTTTPLWSKINDASDVTLIRGAAGATGTCEVALQSGTDPASSVDHTVTVRAKVGSGASGAEKLTVWLYQGATLIATPVNAASISRTTITDYAYTLSAAEADAITNYGDLRLRFSQSTVGAGEYIYVYEASLSVPTAVVATTITPALIALTAAGIAPSVTATQNLLLTPDLYAAALTELAPALGFGVVPPVSALTLAGFAPERLVDRTIVPAVLATSLTAYAPAVPIGLILVPDPLAIVLTGIEPSADVAAPSGPTTVAQDTFTGTNGTLLASHTPDVGGAWNLYALTATGLVNELWNGLLRTTPASDGVDSGGFYRLGTVQAGDCDAYLSVDASSTNFNDLWVRGSKSPNLNAYGFDPMLGQLYRMTAGSQYTLGSIAGGVGKRVRLQVRGYSPTVIKVKMWNIGSAEPGTWGIETTDNTAANQMAQGYCGMYVSAARDDFSEYYSETYIDDFLVTTPGGGGATNTTVTPALKALTAAGIAPSLLVSDNRTYTPPLVALLAAGIAPSAVLGTVLTPPVVGLTASGLAPGLIRGSVLSPALVALVAAGIAPSAVVGTVLAPALKALTAAGIAPSVLFGSPTILTVPVKALVAAGIAPSLAISASRTVTPALAALVAAGIAPALGFGYVSPLAALVAAGIAPAVVKGTVLTPALRALVAAGIAPSLLLGSPTVLTVPLRALVASGIAPDVLATAHRTLTPELAALVALGLAPELVFGITNAVLVPAAALLELAGVAPEVRMAVIYHGDALQAAGRGRLRYPYLARGLRPRG